METKTISDWNRRLGKHARNCIVFVIEAPKIREYNYVVYCEMKMYMLVSWVLLLRRGKNPTWNTKAELSGTITILLESYLCRWNDNSSPFMQTNCCDKCWKCFATQNQHNVKTYSFVITFPKRLKIENFVSENSTDRFLFYSTEYSIVDFFLVFLYRNSPSRHLFNWTCRIYWWDKCRVIYML